MGEVVVLPVVRIEREQHADAGARTALLDMMPTAGFETVDWILDELHRRGFEIKPLVPADGA